MAELNPVPEKQGVAAFILAGGKSARMGQDKALLVWQGETLLERALALARPWAACTRIVGAKTKFEAYGEVIEDIFPGHGPLGGIHAALSSSDADLNLILAVDVPFVIPALLVYLVERARASSCLATVPRLRSGWEPLIAVYRKEFAQVAEDALTRGHNAIHPLFETDRAGTGASVLAVSEEDLIGAGFTAEMFRNINTFVEFESYAEATRAAGDSTSTAKG